MHALEITHSLLKPDGLLINIQPIGKPKPIEVHSDGLVSHAGWIEHRLNFVLHKQSLASLEQVVEDGLFIIEREDTFPFLYHEQSFSTLQKWLAENWENHILDDETAKRTEELLTKAGDNSEVIMREEIHIMRLRST